MNAYGMEACVVYRGSSRSLARAMEATFSAAAQLALADQLPVRCL